MMVEVTKTTVMVPKEGINITLTMGDANELLEFLEDAHKNLKHGLPGTVLRIAEAIARDGFPDEDLSHLFRTHPDKEDE